MTPYARAWLLLPLLLPLVPPAAAAPSPAVVEFSISTAGDEIDVRVAITEASTLVRVTVNLLDVPATILQSAGWSAEGNAWTASFPPAPPPLQYRVPATEARVTLEGEGATSFVRPEATLIRLGYALPSISYAYPDGSRPAVQYRLRVDLPGNISGPLPGAPPWSWTDQLPRGFVAAGNLREVALATTLPARVALVGFDHVPSHVEPLLNQAPQTLQPLLGAPPQEIHLIIAGPPAFSGGITAGSGVLLNVSAPPEVLAHELVHTFQEFHPLFEPRNSLLWFVEGSAVLYGALLEVDAGMATQQQVEARLEDRYSESRTSTPLTNITYGHANERAAYDLGASAVALTETVLREGSGSTRHIGDLYQALRRMDQPVGTGTLLQQVSLMAGSSARLSDALDDPMILAPPRISRGGLVVRLAGTVPEPAVPGPVTLLLEVVNPLLVPLQIEYEVVVDGVTLESRRLSLDGGSTRTEPVPLGPLGLGAHTVRVGPWHFALDVAHPADPHVSAAFYPPPPSQTGAVVVTVWGENRGGVNATIPVTVLLNGSRFWNETLVVPPGANVSRSVVVPDPLTVEVVANGEPVAQVTYAPAAERGTAAPGLPALALVLLTPLARRWARRGCR